MSHCKSLQILDFSSPINSLDAYIHRVNLIPMLTEEQELSYAKRLHNDGDTAAAKLLIMPHLRYVVKVARGFSGYGLGLSDLIQEGNIGLMKAVKRFNPAFGVRLASFAIHWIKAEIHEFILKNWRIVKIATTKAQRKLFFKLKSFKKRLGHWFSKDEVENIANELGVKRSTVLEMETRLSAHDAGFDSPTALPHDNQDEAHDSLKPANFLAADTAYNPAEEIEQSDNQQKMNDALYATLATLDKRSQDILMQRWLTEEKKATLHELADHYQISAERVRQLEKAAMNKLKATLSETNQS